MWRRGIARLGTAWITAAPPASRVVAHAIPRAPSIDNSQWRRRASFYARNLHSTKQLLGLNAALVENEYEHEFDAPLMRVMQKDEVKRVGPSRMAPGEPVSLTGRVVDISPTGAFLHLEPDPRPPATSLPQLPNLVRCQVRCGHLLKSEMITVTGCWQKHAKQGWQIVALPHLAEKLQRLHNVSSSLHPDADSKDDTVGAATTDIRATGVVMGDLRDATWDTTAFVELLAKLCRGQTLSKKVRENIVHYANTAGSALLATQLDQGDVPGLVDAIPGVGKKTAEMLVTAFKTAVVRRQVESYLVLHSHLSPATTLAISHQLADLYGAGAFDQLRDNPYRSLTSLSTVSVTLDDVDCIVHGQLAQCPDVSSRHALLERLTQQRREMAIILALRNAEPDGHACLPVEPILSAAEIMLRPGRRVFGSPVCTAAELGIMADAGQLVAETVRGTLCYYQCDLHSTDSSVAKRLKQLVSESPLWGTWNTQRWIDAADDVESLSPQQREVAAKLLQSKLAVLTGGPGTGKTTLLRCLVHTLEQHGQVVLLTSPTGRAARRLAEATDRKAHTVHMAVSTQVARQADVVIVDEASVLDARILEKLLNQMPRDAALYFVGDIDQLPPVGPSHVLRSLVEADCVPIHRLTEVHRQSKASALVAMSRQINANTFERVPSESLELGTDTDFAFIKCNADEIEERIAKLVSREIPALMRQENPNFNAASDIQVLVPTKKGRGVNSTGLNRVLQKALLPIRHQKSRPLRHGVDYRRGDKVIQLENDYERGIFNGDVGFVSEIDLDTDSPTALTVTFGSGEDENIAKYTEGQLDQLSLAYAITIHKSQGSEYPVVVLPVMARDNRFSQRRALLYTAMTRAKRLLVCVGEETGLHKAQSNCGINDDELVSWSKLPEWLAK